jgi:hypothetical protein
MAFQQLGSFAFFSIVVGLPITFEGQQGTDPSGKLDVNPTRTGIASRMATAILILIRAPILQDP